MTTSRERKTRVFISYSRKDSVFAESLRDALIASGFEAYLDKHDIAPGEPWRERLTGLITTADTVVFCLSPNFVASPICDWEVNEAERLGKRLLPVVASQTPDEDVPQRLKRLNYIHVRYETEKAQGLESLVTALNTDIAWIREHTRLGERAREWRVAEGAESTLLRGEHIAAAEAWLTTRPREAPDITPEIASFIAASRTAETARTRRAQRRGRVVTAASLAATVIMAVLGWQMYWQWREGQIRHSRVLANYAGQQVARGDAVAGILLALEAIPDSGAGFLERLRPLTEEAGVSLYRAVHRGAGNWSLASHNGAIQAARLSPDLRHIATGSRDGTVRIWDAESGRQRSVLIGHEGSVNALAFSPDGHLLATGSADWTVRLWDWRAGSLLMTLSGHLAPIERISFSARGTHLLSIAANHAVHVWDANSGGLVVVAGERSGLDSAFVKLEQADFLLDGSLLTVGGLREKVARVWDVWSGGGSREILKSNDDGNSRIEVSPDVKRLARISRGRIEFREIATGKALGTLDATQGWFFWWTRFSPDGATMAARVDLGDGIHHPSRIDLVNAESGKIRCSTAVVDSGILRFNFDDSGRRLVTYVGSGTNSRQKNSPKIAIWDTSTCAALASLDDDAKANIQLEKYVISDDGSRLLTWSGSKVAVWDLEAGRYLAEHRVWGSAESWDNFALDPSGRLIAGFNGRHVEVFDALSGRHLHRLDGHGDTISAPLFAAGGRRLVTFRDTSVAVWDTGTWTKLAPPITDYRKIYSVSISGDGRHALVVYEAPDADRTAEKDLLGTRVAELGRVIGVEDGREVVLRPGAEARHWAELQSPDGQHDYREENGKDKIVDVSTDRTIATLPGPFGMVLLSADRRRLVGVGDNKTWVWEFPSGRLVSNFIGAKSDIGLKLMVSPDGRRVITGPDFGGPAAASSSIGPDDRLIASGADKARSLLLWDADTGKLIKALEGHTDTIIAQVLGPKGWRLITISRDGTARLWSLQSGLLEAVFQLVPRREALIGKGSAAFSPDGMFVATLTNSEVEIWRLGETIDSLARDAKKRVPRCLSEDERRAFFLSPTPPRWCYDFKKWPYHDHSKTPPPPYSLGDRLIQAWDMLGGDTAVATLSRVKDWMRERAYRLLPGLS